MAVRGKHCDQELRRCLKVVVAMAAILAICPDGLAAGKRTVMGTIRSYECGDNCYLTIVDARGKQHDGLCHALLCGAWNNAQEMPKRFIGRKVRVTITTGVQVNAEGDPMGDFPAFRKIELL